MRAKLLDAGSQEAVLTMNLDREREELERIKAYIVRAIKRGDQKRLEKLERRFYAQQQKIKDVEAWEAKAKANPDAARVVLAAMAMLGGR
jgi:hypothetical protein